MITNLLKRNPFYIVNSTTQAQDNCNLFNLSIEAKSAAVAGNYLADTSRIYRPNNQPFNIA